MANEEMNKQAADEMAQETPDVEVNENLEENLEEILSEAAKENEEAFADGKPSEEAEEATEEKAEEEKKGFFKKDKKAKEIAALKERTEALEDQVRRQMAEFDNYRKRTDKEKEQMFSMGERNVAEKMLPIIDNFERGLATIPAEESESSFAQGMQMIYKQMIEQLAAIGVKPIECVGKEFDPDFHNAVMQVETEDYASGVVAQELLKGYMYRDTVLRHSMVGVAV